MCISTKSQVIPSATDSPLCRSSQTKVEHSLRKVEQIFNKPISKFHNGECHLARTSANENETNFSLFTGAIKFKRLMSKQVFLYLTAKRAEYKLIESRVQQIRWSNLSTSEFWFLTRHLSLLLIFSLNMLHLSESAAHADIMILGCDMFSQRH